MDIIMESLGIHQIWNKEMVVLTASILSPTGRLNKTNNRTVRRSLWEQNPDILSLSERHTRSKPGSGSFQWHGSIHQHLLHRYFRQSQAITPFLYRCHHWRNPPQKNERLVSRYDHDAFHVSNEKCESTLQPRELTGLTRTQLLEKMETIYRKMTGNGYEYHVPPELDTDSIYLYGVLQIEENGRRGPFRLWFQHDIEQPGNFYLQASSCLGRINQLRKSLFQEIKQKLTPQGIHIQRKNQFYWLHKPISSFSAETTPIINELINFIKYTDQLKEEYYKQADEEVIWGYWRGR